jgi:uncharacterized protein YcnI
MKTFNYAHALFAGALLTCGVALAHIRIYPNESILGAREKYTMRVPNEKQVATIRIEGEFPKDLKIYDFEFKPADGKKEEFTGPVGTFYPSPVVKLKPAPADPGK